MSPKTSSTDRTRRAVQTRRERAASAHFTITFATADPPTWRIEGSSGQSYRVMLPAHPAREGAQCSCPDFRTRGLGTCKHVEAVLAFAAIHPPERSTKVPEPSVPWADLRARHAAALREELASGATYEHLLRRLRKEGRALTRSDLPRTES